MAQWKKIIVSGSDAHLSSITASNGIKFTLANHPTSGGLQGNASTIPLVVDTATGTIHTGSDYSSTEGTVVPLNEQLLTNGVVILGAGTTAIQTASATQNVDFNSAKLNNIAGITASNATLHNLNISDANFETSSLAFSADFGADGTGSTLIINSSSHPSASDGFSGLRIDTPVTMSTVPDGGAEVGEVLMISSSGEIVKRDASVIGGVTGVTGGTNISVNQQTGGITASLNDNIFLTSATASAGLFFSSSTNDGKVFTIDYAKVVSQSNGPVFHHPDSGSLNISASHIHVDGTLGVRGLFDLSGSMVFQGFSFQDSQILSHSGSNSFGSQSTDIHSFTGSLIITGSELKLMTSTSTKIKLSTDTGTISASAIEGSGANITALNANNISSGQLNAARITGLQLISQSAQVDGTGITNNSATIGGVSITLGGTVAQPAFDLTNATSYQTTNLSGTITNAQLQGSIANSKLANSSITIAGESTALGGSITQAKILGGSNAISSSGITTATQGGVIITNNGTAASEVILTNLGTSDTPTFSGLTIDNNAHIKGTLHVDGGTTTFNTTNLSVEDRFIVLGSGSSNMDDNLDVGIIFDSASQDGAGMALYYDNDKNRLAVGLNVKTDDFSASNSGQGTVNAIGSGDSRIGGNLVTVREINVEGTNLGDNISNNELSASFGKGEMIIDSGNDIWIYAGI